MVAAMDWIRRWCASPSLHAALLAAAIGGGLSLEWPKVRGGIDADQIHEEIACEEALAYLLGCCPDLDRHDVACRYSRDTQELSGCEECESGSDPDISLAESRAYRRTSCSQIRATGVCERVASADREWDHCADYDDGYY